MADSEDKGLIYASNPPEDITTSPVIIEAADAFDAKPPAQIDYEKLANSHHARALKSAASHSAIPPKISAQHSFTSTNTSHHSRPIIGALFGIGKKDPASESVEKNMNEKWHRATHVARVEPATTSGGTGSLSGAKVWKSHGDMVGASGGAGGKGKAVHQRTMIMNAAFFGTSQTSSVMDDSNSMLKTSKGGGVGGTSVMNDLARGDKEQLEEHWKRAMTVKAPTDDGTAASTSQHADGHAGRPQRGMIERRHTENHSLAKRRATIMASALGTPAAKPAGDVVQGVNHKWDRAMQSNKHVIPLGSSMSGYSRSSASGMHSPRSHHGSASGLNQSMNNGGANISNVHAEGAVSNQMATDEAFLNPDANDSVLARLGRRLSIGAGNLAHAEVHGHDGVADEHGHHAAGRRESIKKKPHRGITHNLLAI
eukprot:jgi/Hompol1/6986/HPOL_005140-RA